MNFVTVTAAVKCVQFLPRTEVTRFVMMTETVTSTVTVTPTPQGTCDLLSIVTIS